MYQSNYNANPTLTLNPFTDSIEAIVVFKSNKEFLDSLNKAIVDAGGNPESVTVVRPDVTLTELMNTLSLSGIRFTFDPSLKKGSNTAISGNTADIPVSNSATSSTPNKVVIQITGDTDAVVSE
jgi:ABC-type glucose/galactose transport system permease subunit